MRNYQCQVCGEGILLEPSEVAESGPLCMEHLFSEEFPALDQLADEASAQEKRPENPRQETTQTASTETHQEEGSVMDQSTATPIRALKEETSGLMSSIFESVEPINDAMDALVMLRHQDTDPDGLMDTLSICGADTAAKRFWPHSDGWTLAGMIEVSYMWGLKPSVLVDHIMRIALGEIDAAEARDLIVKDRGPLGVEKDAGIGQGGDD